MNLGDFLLLNTGLAKIVLEKLPAWVLMRMGRDNAFWVFNEAYKTKRYSRLLRETNLNDSEIKSSSDFSKLPIIDKQSYILNSDLRDLLKVKLENNYTIEASGGYSGKAFFWPRYTGQDNGFANYIKLGLSKTFNIEKKSTLVINTFALGTWVSGIKFAINICKLANDRKIKMTAINTGTNFNDALNALLSFSSFYDQTIIVGYPPFVKNLISAAVKEDSFRLSKPIHVISGGEGFVEEWREEIAALLKIKIDNFKSLIVSAYGSADTGLEIGYETPLTIILRRLLWKRPELQRVLLQDKIPVLPLFFQYNPMNIWIEGNNGELLFTSDSGIPIVRYNLHDMGGVITYEECIEFLSKYIDVNSLINKYKPFHLPICYVYGREDGSISVDGANIYIQDVQKVINSSEEINELIRKRFNSVEDVLTYIPNVELAKRIYEANAFVLDDFVLNNLINDFKIGVEDSRLTVSLELNTQQDLTESNLLIINKVLTKVFIILLYKYSSGYSEIVNENLDSANLIIRTVNLHSGIFTDGNAVKRKYIKHGK